VKDAKIIKENSMGIDQRKHVRTPTQLMIQYSDQHLFFTEFLSDLSPRGMCIVASKPLEPGTKLVITSSTQPPIKIEGIVVWSKKSIKNKFKYEIGVQFVELSQDQKSQIADIISSICWEMNSTH
jgi:c-di-GMP-binding flagellar brake protein YcgR